MPGTEEDVDRVCSAPQVCITDLSVLLRKPHCKQPGTLNAVHVLDNVIISPIELLLEHRGSFLNSGRTANKAKLHGGVRLE